LVSSDATRPTRSARSRDWITPVRSRKPRSLLATQPQQPQHPRPIASRSPPRALLRSIVGKTWIHDLGSVEHRHMLVRQPTRSSSNPPQRDTARIRRSVVDGLQVSIAHARSGRGHKYSPRRLSRLASAVRGGPPRRPTVPDTIERSIGQTPLDASSILLFHEIPEVTSASTPCGNFVLAILGGWHALCSRAAAQRRRGPHHDDAGERSSLVASPHDQVEFRPSDLQRRSGRASFRRRNAISQRSHSRSARVLNTYLHTAFPCTTVRGRSRASALCEPVCEQQKVR
jgi:hypothetical protein